MLVILHEPSRIHFSSSSFCWYHCTLAFSRETLQRNQRHLNNLTVGIKTLNRQKRNIRTQQTQAENTCPSRGLALHLASKNFLQERACIRTGEAVAALFFRDQDRRGRFALEPRKDLLSKMSQCYFIISWCKELTDPRGPHQHTHVIVIHCYLSSGGHTFTVFL